MFSNALDTYFTLLDNCDQAVFTQKQIRCCHERHHTVPQNLNESFVPQAGGGGSFWQKLFGQGREQEQSSSVWKLRLAIQGLHGQTFAGKCKQLSAASSLAQHTQEQGNARVWQSIFFQRIKAEISLPFDLCSFSPPLSFHASSGSGLHYRIVRSLYRK